jgi:hypothetical protein
MAQETKTATAPQKGSTTKRRVKTPATKVKAAKEPQVNPHIERGLKLDRYTGPSSYVNANRKPQIMLGKELSPSKLTSRAQAGLYALRDSYGGNQFEPRGFDNGILRDLVAAGLVTVSGGQKATINGKEYAVDGASPVKLKITSVGLSYGKA